MTAMPTTRNTVAAVHEAGLRAKAIAGGAPLTQSCADEIQADGYVSGAPGDAMLCRSPRGQAASAIPTVSSGRAPVTTPDPRREAARLS
jgi:hypothetical protein